MRDFSTITNAHLIAFTLADEQIQFQNNFYPSMIFHRPEQLNLWSSNSLREIFVVVSRGFRKQHPKFLSSLEFLKPHSITSPNSEREIEAWHKRFVQLIHGCRYSGTEELEKLCGINDVYQASEFLKMWEEQEVQAEMRKAHANRYGAVNI